MASNLCSRSRTAKFLLLPNGGFYIPSFRQTKTGVGWKRRPERRGLGFSSGDSVLSYSIGFIELITERGLQNGFGEICSTPLTLKLLNVSETISFDT